MVVFNTKHRIYGKRTAARKIQRAWRTRRKRFRRDYIKTAKDVKKVVRRMEQMSYDQYLNNSSLSSTPIIMTNFTNFVFKNESNNPPDRDSLTQRTTQKVFLSTVRLSGTVVPSDATNRIRLCMFRAKRSAQTSNPISAINCFNDTDGPTTPYIDLPINYRNVQCLWDYQFNLQDTVAGAVYPPYKTVKKVFTLKKNLKYNLNELDNSDFPVNNYQYFLVGMSDSSIAPHPASRLGITVSFKNTGD